MSAQHPKSKSKRLTILDLVNDESATTAAMIQ